MKRRLTISFIFGTILIVLFSYRLIASTPYTDDAYFWPIVDTIIPSQPVYDRNAREFIFLEDTIQYLDSVNMPVWNR